MDFVEKARIRIESWIKHNDHHQEDYENFADQLQAAGKKDSAEYVRKVIDLTTECTECLQSAMKSLE
jgi:hypothetical protein